MPTYLLPIIFFPCSIYQSEYKAHALLCKRDLVVGAVRMVECPACGKLFRSQEGLAVHVAKDHEVSVLLLLL